MKDEANPLGGHEISTQVLQSRVIGKFGGRQDEVADKPCFRGKIIPEGNDAANPIPLRADHQHAIGEPSLCFLD